MSSPFDVVGRFTYGYDRKQVDEFLARARAAFNGDGDMVTSSDVRSTAFDPVRGGYDFAQVDAALDRLEDAFAEREREDAVESQGEQQWLAELTEKASVIRTRLHRAPGARFRRGARREPSYDVQDVDALMDRLIAYFEQGAELEVKDVRRAVFSPQVGNTGYQEAQVDAFLDRVVEIMNAIK